MTLDVVDDYHTGVKLSNGNESNLANGDVIKASDISGVFTSKNNTLNDTVAADDIYIVAASDWESDKSASNSHLAKEITIPDRAAGTYDYYIVVRDLSVANEYWASEKQTVDVSENATGFDAETWYTYKDSSTNIEWHYKLDGNGDIIGLYTKSNIVKIVDNGGTANSTSASSNKKTDTTNTENTSSTAKTADKPVSVVEDDVEMEGSTNVVAASTISSSSMKQLGESAQTQVPATTEKAKDQKATITLNQIAADADAQISSNGASLTDATEAQKNNALKIINWYLNNLDELGKLGASEIRAAANDENKSVVCDILASVDVVPSADQQTAIDNQEDVDLRLSSADIEDGALYLIVHESQLREGIYDVLLSRASGDSIEINIPDLSPVTVSKITVNDIEQLEMVTESTQTEETPEALVEEESSNTGFRIAMYILLIVAIGGLAALFFIAKKRNGGSIPFKRN